MKTKNLIIVILLILIFFLPSTIIYGNDKCFPYVKQSITDVLLLFGELLNISVIPDETVEGTIEFNEEMLCDTLECFFDFLEDNHLFYEAEDNIYRISKIRSMYNQENCTISFNAENAKIEDIIERISEHVEPALLFDALPEKYISVHATDVEPIKLIIMVLCYYNQNLG